MLAGALPRGWLPEIRLKNTLRAKTVGRYLPRLRYYSNLRPTLQVETLPSGLTVALAKLAGSSNTATVGVWLRFGSRDETQEENGTVHFLEHMTFKGTRSKSKTEIERYIENMGAHLNAYTSKEHVAYFGNCLSDKAPEMIRLLADIIQNSIINPRSVEEEKYVILRESAEVNLIHEEVLMDKIHYQCFPKNGLGRIILGTDARILNMAPATLKSFVHRKYKPENMIVIATGDFQPDQIMAQCADSFVSRKKSLTEKSLAYTPASPLLGTTELYIDEWADPYLSKPVLMIGMTGRGVAWTDRHLFATMVTRIMLGGTPMAISEQQAANTFRGSKVRVPSTLTSAHKLNELVFYDAYYRDCGLLGVYSALECPNLTTRAKLGEAAVVFETMKMAATEVYKKIRNKVGSWSSEDLDRGKEALLSDHAQAWDNSVTACEEIGRQLLFYPDEAVRKYDWFANNIDQVNVEDCRNIAMDALLDPSQIAITGLLRFPIGVPQYIS